MAALIVRDISGQATLAEVVEAMTQLADITTNYALAHTHRLLAAQFGEPLDSRGQPQRLLIVGMGGMVLIIVLAILLPIIDMNVLVK